MPGTGSKTKLQACGDGVWEAFSAPAAVNELDRIHRLAEIEPNSCRLSLKVVPGSSSGMATAHWSLFVENLSASILKNLKF